MKSKRKIKHRKLRHKGGKTMTTLQKSKGKLTLADNTNEIQIVLLDTDKHRAQIGIEAPKNIKIQLAETYYRMQADLQQQVEAYHYQTQNERKATEYSTINQSSKYAKPANISLKLIRKRR